MGEVTKINDQQIIDLLTAIINFIGVNSGSPIRVLISLGLGAAVATIAWFVIKNQIKQWEKEKAKEDTDKGHQDQIDIRLPQAPEENKKDNDNRKKMDGLE